MVFGSNILKKESAYYTLHNATLMNGVLHIAPGGYATEELTISDLPAITSSMLFTCIIEEEYTDHYKPNIQVLVHAKMSGTNNINLAYMYPVEVTPGKYECIFSLKDGEYEELYVTISSDVDVTFSLWELCAEAADETTQVEIEGVKQALAKLLYDYNSGEFIGDQEETTVAFITCKLLQNTDVQGHFSFTFIVSKACCMTIRFYDNESEELFSPLYYDLKPGKHSIGIPHAFLNRKAGMHNFYISAQVSSGIFTVPVRGALFSIDAGYLAQRELELTMDVTDIAVKQLSMDYGPNEIWAVGLEAEKAYVRKRPYRESNANVAWTAVGVLGDAVAAAIEFDGIWGLRADSDKFTLETEDDPWYFWVDPDQILFACHGLPTDENPAIILDNSVVGDIKAVKGYSSVDYPEQDQGLIVTYIKTNGTVYYRSYSYDTTLGQKKWDAPEELPVPAFKYSFSSVHRLNDYRVAFILSGDTDNYWVISSRTYVGQSVYPEKLNPSFIEDHNNYFPFFQIYPSDYISPVPQIISIGQEEAYVQKTKTQITTYVYTKTTSFNLGTREYVEEHYGSIQQDSEGYYIIKDGQQVYVILTQVTEKIPYEEKRYIYYAVFDKELIASDAYWPMDERFSFSGFTGETKYVYRMDNNAYLGTWQHVVDEYGQIYESSGAYYIYINGTRVDLRVEVLNNGELDDITWQIENGHTTITFIFATASKNTEVSITMKHSIFLKIQDGQYITNYYNDIVMYWDITNYTSASVSELPITVSASNFRLNMDNLNVLESLSTELIEATATLSNVIINEPTLVQDQIEDTCAVSLVSINLGIYDPQDAPV